MESELYKLKEQARRLESGSFTKEIKNESKGVVNGGFIFGGIGIAYAMITNKNTFLFGIAGFMAGIIMTVVYNKIGKISI